MSRFDSQDAQYRGGPDPVQRMLVGLFGGATIIMLGIILYLQINAKNPTPAERGHWPGEIQLEKDEDIYADHLATGLWQSENNGDTLLLRLSPDGTGAFASNRIRWQERDTSTVVIEELVSAEVIGFDFLISEKNGSITGKAETMGTELSFVKILGTGATDN